MSAGSTSRLRRWLRRLLKLFAAFVLLVIVLAVAGYFVLKNPAAISWIATRIVQHAATRPLTPPPAAMPGALVGVRLRTDAALLRGPGELYSLAGIWDVHLRFNSNQWAGLGPRRIESMPSFLDAEVRPVVRNPAAQRPGVAGVLGFDQPWSTGDVEFGGLSLSNVAIRFKGNGTFLDSMGTYRRPFKVGLARGDAPRRVARVRELNLSNMAGDPSGVRETLAYEVHREAGVLAPRTAYARVRLTVEGRFEEGLLGLYLLVENPDADWLERVAGVPGGVLFKPVTYELFEDLGGDWAAYDGIYDPKGKVDEEAKRAVMGLSRLVSHASDAEFAEQLGAFLDLPAFARFMACQVLLANYDGILATGQNFLVYWDPRDRLMRFVPWDLDRAFGNIPFIGSEAEREQASLRHPWVGANRFLERVYAVPEFARLYDAELRRIAEDVFTLERLDRRAVELATQIRPVIAEESMARLASFEKALLRPDLVQDPGEKEGRGDNLRRFLAARVRSVADQLAGRSEGLVPQRRRPF